MVRSRRWHGASGRVLVALGAALLAASACKRAAELTPPELTDSVELAAGQKVAARGVEIELVTTGHSRQAAGPCIADLALRIQRGAKTASIEPLWRHAEGVLDDLAFQITPTKRNGRYRVKLYRRASSNRGPLLSNARAIEIAQREGKRLGCAVEDVSAQGTTMYDGALEPPLGGGCELSVGLHTAEVIVHQGPSATR
ncbi:MAG TPA: hypothetical protein PKD61_04980 [Polyangiaceae bacterium]|nr:hypothetical protein [Polyangiaceae bacterium]